MMELNLTWSFFAVELPDSSLHSFLCSLCTTPSCLGMYGTALTFRDNFPIDDKSSLLLPMSWLSFCFAWSCSFRLPGEVDIFFAFQQLRCLLECSIDFFPSIYENTLDAINTP